MKEKEYLVYLVTNMTNGKQYVGQTCKTSHRRWKQHVSEAFRNGDHAIGRAIRKHGKNSFAVTVLRERLGKAEADAEEDLAIVTLKTMEYDYGYNLARGGSCGSKPKRPDVCTTKLVEKYEQGKTIYELADEFGLTFTGVANRLRESGIKMRNRGYPKKDINPEEISRRYQSGETSTILGSEFGCHPHTIRRILKSKGINRRPRGYAKGTRQPIHKENQ